MIKYNSATNLVTTEDVTLAGKSASLGKSLDEVLVNQLNDITALKSNVKWLYKYGGVGSGSGGNAISGNFKCTITVTYTNIDNEKVSLILRTNDTLLVAPNTPFTINIQRTSIATLPQSSYSATFLGNSTLFDEFGKTTFTSYFTEKSNQCVLTVMGEKVLEYTFNIYTSIYNIDSGIYSDSLENGGSVYPDGSSIYDDILSNPNAEFRAKITTDLDGLFTVTTKSILVNDIPININESGIYKIDNSNIFNLLLDKGIYTITITYNIYTKPTSISEGTNSTITEVLNYIRKNTDEVYIYCYSNINGVLIYKSKLNPAEAITTNFRNIGFSYKVYGTSYDSVGSPRQVIINNGEPIMAYIGKTHFYNIPNEVTDTNIQEVPIVFECNDQTFTYYIYVKLPDSLSYIFLGNNAKKYYRAKGANTDEISLNIIKFPNLPSGQSIYKFTTSPGSIEFTSANSITTETASVNSGNINSSSTVVDWVSLTNAAVSNSPISFDTIVNIGINFKDSSYEKEIFRLENSDYSSDTISIYRNKILLGITEYNKFNLPKDGDYHLLTFYFKLKYNASPNDTSNFESGYTPHVVIYIDGVLETIPISTNMIVTRNFKVTLNISDSTYNFFGIETFNKIDSSTINQLSPSIYRYIKDFDPLIVSNYYITYFNAHKEDNIYNNEIELPSFDKSFYNIFVNNNNCWINYYKAIPNVPDTLFSPINKFISLGNNIEEFAKLSHLPIYRIKPAFTKETLSMKNFGINEFIYNTMMSFGEDAKLESYNCDFLRYDISSNKWNSIIPTTVNTPILMLVKYLGSSTLLYGAKNFEISAALYLDQNTNITYNYYFNPNDLIFRRPETSFNLKADIVDSSSCTNNILGLFINMYMKSPFDTAEDTFNACLVGEPVLLFVANSDRSSNDDDLENIFLGIYNLNLNRSSVNNLGYLKLPNNLSEYIGVDNKTKWYITNSNQEIAIRNLAVAEILGNSYLYDFSLYDDGLLRKMLGDYYVYNATNKSIATTYDRCFHDLIKDFSTFVRSEILKDYSGSSNLVFPTTDYGYNLYSTPQEIRNILNSKLGESSDQNNLFIINDLGSFDTLTNIDKIISDNDVITSKSEDIPYVNLSTDLRYKNLSKVGNSKYQYKVIYTKNLTTGEYEVLTEGLTYFYYIEDSNASYNPETASNRIDLYNALLYYIICMVFAMVDSVLKNLTIKTPDKGLPNKTWYVEFYDMDTGIKLNNSGGSSHYQAFSDYVDNNGRIIQDYKGQDAAGWFDTPSSYLFLFAKYAKLLGAAPEENKYFTPFYEYLRLRGIVLSDMDAKPYDGELQSALYFCKKYLYNYLGTVNPLIWNLNYMYKYFSATNNNTDDTEAGRFNGTMKYTRLDWLENRLHYLDALFGIRNTRNIGSTNTPISDISIKTDSNIDILMSKSCFPAYKKGVENVTSSAVVKDEARTPLILLASTNSSKLYITDDSGRAEINLSISTNVEVGFYGSYHLLDISDCASFLLNSSLINTIESDRLLNIVINGNCRAFNIDLTKNLAVDNITIGSSTGTNIRVSVANSQSSITISGDSENKSTLNNLTILRVSCDTITLSNLVITNNLILTSISGFSRATTVIKFTNCIFNKPVTFNGQFSLFEFISCTFNSTLTITTNSSNCESIVLNGCICKLLCKINITSISKLNIIGGTYYEGIENTNGRSLQEVIIGNSSNYVTTKYLYLFSSIMNTFNYTLDSLNNLLVAEKTLLFVQNFSNTPVIMSLPGFTLLEDLFGSNFNSNPSSDKFRWSLTSGGVAFSKMTCNALFGRVIKSLENNAKLIFFNCNNLNYNLFANKGAFYNVQIPESCDLSGAFGSIPTTTNTFSTSLVITILSNLKLTMKIKGLFIFRRFNGLDVSNNLSGLLNNFNNLNNFATLVAEVIPATEDRHIATFFGTNFLLINNSLGAALGGKFLSFLGEGPFRFIESGTFNNFTYILDGRPIANLDLTDYRYYRKQYPFLFYNGTSPIPNVLYNQLFSKAQTLGINIYDSDDIAIDFGNGMGGNLKYFYSIKSCYNVTNYGNIKNIQNMFNKMNGGGYDSTITVMEKYHFSNPTKVLDYNDVDTVDLYELLVDTSTPIPRLKSNACSLFDTLTDNYDGADCGAFYKKITGDQLLKLLLLLELSKILNLGPIFRNCHVLNTNENLLSCALTPFTSLNHTFHNCKFYNNSNTLIPINTDYIFCNSNINVGLITYNKTTTPVAMYLTFRESYLAPFTSNSLGKERAIRTAAYTFYDCTYNYDSILPHLDLTNYLTMHLKGFDLPTDDTIWPLLPLNFLDNFNTSVSLLYTFASSKWDNNHLKGCLPKSDTNYFSSSNIKFSTSTFKGANIWYTNHGKVEETVSGNVYIIFPTWYTINLGENLFDVFIPMPLISGDNALHKCCLFESWNEEDKYTMRTNNWGTLPNFADLDLSLDLTYCYNAFFNERWEPIDGDKAKILYISPDKNYIYKAGNNYTNMIPFALAYVLAIDPNNSTIILNLTSIPSSTVKPLIKGIELTSETTLLYLFRKQGPNFSDSIKASYLV